MKAPLPAIKTIAKGIYQHYKGSKYKYEVIDFARHSETLETMVVYRALYDDCNLWVRPLDMFTENIELAGESMPRFKFIGDVGD